MEARLKDKDRLGEEWQELSKYEPKAQNETTIGTQPQNMTRNRHSNILPCKKNKISILETFLNKLPQLTNS